MGIYFLDLNSSLQHAVLGDLSLTVPFCEKFREAAPTIRVDEFKIFNSNFATVDTDVFHDLIRSFMYVNELLLIGSARADQVTDGFLRGREVFERTWPYAGGVR